MDLTTTYMGLELAGPIVAAASPLCKDVGSIKEMADAGAGAVVLFSLFEEQIEHEARELEYYLQYGAERFAESLSYFPDVGDYRLGAEDYLEHVHKLKETVTIPVIASLNGITTGGWVRYAEQIEQAGADAIELNAYYIPTDPRLASQRVEQVYLDVLKAIKERVSIPVAMKLSAFFSSTANMMTRLDEAGADALVLFNRFYQPDIDLEAMEVAPRLMLSSSWEARLPMRWIAILYGKVSASLAATTGIHTPEDVMRMILVGADVTMVCSALLSKGIGYLKDLHDGLERLMEAKGYDSISQIKGMLSQQKCVEPAAFERANYMKTLNGYGPTSTLE